MMNYRKFRKNVKAVSPVISVLLMIVVAVAASLVTYAWVMGYLGFTTNKVGKAIQVQSVDINTKTVYVQNVGDSQLKVVSFYVNGVLDPVATGVVGIVTPANPLITLDGAPDNQVTLDKSATITIVSSIDFTQPQVTVRIVTVDGTFAEYTKTFP